MAVPKYKLILNNSGGLVSVGDHAILNVGGNSQRAGEYKAFNKD